MKNLRLLFALSFVLLGGRVAAMQQQINGDISFEEALRLVMEKSERPEWAQDLGKEEYEKIVREQEEYEKDRKKKLEEEIVIEEEEEEGEDIQIGCVEENCALCVSEFEDTDEVGILEVCQHSFCKQCLDRGFEIWKRDNVKPMCPCCRKPIGDPKEDITYKLYKDVKPANDKVRKNLEKKRAKLSKEYENFLQNRNIAHALLHTTLRVNLMNNLFDGLFSPTRKMTKDEETLFNNVLKAFNTQILKKDDDEYYPNFDEKVLLCMLISALIMDDEELQETWKKFKINNKHMVEKYFRPCQNPLQLFIDSGLRDSVKSKNGFAINTTAGPELEKILKDDIKDSALKGIHLIGPLMRKIKKDYFMRMNIEKRLKSEASMFEFDTMFFGY